MRRCSLLLVAMLLGVASTWSADHSFIFKTRTDNGPVTERTAVRVGYTLVNQALTIVGDLDTTDAPVLGMIIQIPRYEGKKATPYPLTGTTTYRYGRRSDQIFTCTNGSLTVTDVNPETGAVTATFQWTGVANLSSGISLRVTISEGRLVLGLKPKLTIATVPRAGVKVGPDEALPVKINISKENGDPVQGATVTIGGLATLFEGIEPTKTYTTDVRGDVRINYKTKKDIEKGKYQLRIDAKKDKFEDANQLVYEVEVNERGRYWYAKCNGFPFHEFDAGEGERWKEDDVFVVADGPVIWNGIFRMEGPVRIDTTPNKFIVNCRSIRMDGSGDGAMGDLVIVESTTAFALPCSNVINFGLDKLATKLSGGLIEKPVIELLGDGFQSNGIKIGATVVLGRNVWSGCNSDNAKDDDPNEKAKFAIEGSATYSSIAPKRWTFTVSGELQSFAPVSALCINSAKVAYSSANDELDITGKARALCFASADIGIGFRDGKWNKGNFTFELENCIPIPETPLCFRGGGGSIENIQIGNPFKARIESTMELIGKDNIMQFTLGGGFEADPVAALLDGTLRLLKVEKISEAKPWQIEITASAKLGFDMSMRNPTLEITGGASVGHLGGDYILTGTSKLTYAGTTDVFSGTVDGRCVIPTFAYTGEMKWPIKVLHECAKDILPIQVGTIKGVMSITPGAEQYMRANVDLGPIRARLSGALLELFEAYFGTGQAHIVLDFDKTFPLEIGPGVINLTIGTGTAKAGDDVQAKSASATVGSGVEALLVHLQGATGTVTVRAPDGRSWNASTPADGVRRFDLPNGFQLWTVQAPAEGVWTVTADEWDSVLISARGGVVTSPFNIDVRREGSTLVVTWPKVDGGTVAIQADVDGENFDGIPLVTAPSGDGSAVIQLADGQVPCSFYITAMRTLGGQLAEARSAETFAAQRVALMPPTNVAATRNDRTGTTVVSWTPSESPDVRRYGVRLRRGSADTLVASATRFASSAEFTLDNSDGQVYVVAIGENGAVGCPSELGSITTSVQQADASSKALPYPQPATTVVRLPIDGDVTHWMLLDAQGRSVYGVATVNESELTVDVSRVATGSYVLTVQTAAGRRTYPVMVVR